MSTIPKKLDITIGIPAYNEERNIKQLLESLLIQKKRNYNLIKIIIVVEPCTDKTLDKINEVKDKRINVIHNENRIGQALSQNKIIEEFEGDILVLLNADIIPKDEYLLDNLIKPFIEQKNITLVGGRVQPIQPENTFEKVLNFSCIMKDAIYESISSDNLYLCHGRVRAFSKKLASQIQWSATFGEDAYSYLFCKNAGEKFYYAKDAAILYKLPSNLSEHLRQSTRFFQSKSNQIKVFSEKWVKQEYSIPLYILVFSILKFFIMNPIYMILYLQITIYSKLKARFGERSSHLWTVSESSKNLIKKNN